MAWVRNGTPDTLTSTGDTLTISDLTAKQFNFILGHNIQSGAVAQATRLDNDSGSNYAYRRSVNGATDVTSGSFSRMVTSPSGGTHDEFSVQYIINISSEEKLNITHSMASNTAGAANAPSRAESVNKWANTSTQFTRIDNVNVGAGDYAADSNLSALNGDTAGENVLPTNVQIGTRFEATDTRKIYYRVDYDNDKWQEEGSIYLGGRGVFGGGNDGSNSNVIDYITIATTGNATDFGDLTVARRVDAACDDASRGLFCGVSSGTIDYITIGTTGNATDFGDLNTNGEGAGGVSSETRGCIGGGYIGGGNSTNVIDYVTIQTTGNATDFGDLTVARYGIAGGLSNNTRGCFAGGTPSTTTIDYITIATTGNATDFGDLTVGRYNMQGLSSSTRGCIGGGTATTNTIDYITIATTGNATDFGDLTVARRKAGGVSTETRGVWGGGHTGSTQTNVMDYITIDTTGSATDFGDLTVARDGSSGVAD